MKILLPLGLLFLFVGMQSSGEPGSLISKPATVHIGAILTFNSTIGKAANIAIETAVKDINSDPSVLGGTKLVLSKQDTNYSGFLGIVEALKFMETDIVAIIGPQSSMIAHVISHVANELHVPLLSYSATDPMLSSLQYPFFVRTTQNDFFQMAAVAEFVDFYGWSQVSAIFIDDNYGRNGISALVDKLAERRCKISYKVGLPPGPDVARNDITDILVEIGMLEPRVIVLHANPDSGLLVLSVAHHLEMMGNGYVWLVTDWLSSVVDSLSPLPADLMNSMQGVVCFHQHTADSARKRAFISRWKRLTMDEGIGTFGINSYGLYAYDTVWLLAHAINSFLSNGGIISFSKDSRLMNMNDPHVDFGALSFFDGGKRLLQNILQTKFRGLTGIVQFDENKSLIRPSYDIINVVGTGVRNVGYLSNYSGLSVVSPETLYLKPPNRSVANQHLSDVIWPGGTTTVPRGWVFANNGRRLRIGIPNRVSFKEFVSLDKDINDAKGFSIDVFVAAVNLLPYAVPYQFVPFGNGKENPQYSELARLISVNEFDGAVGDIAIVTNRTKIVDFTQPFTESGLVVVTPITKLNSDEWAFMRPFTVEMWCVTGAFFLMVGAVVWILEHRYNDDFRGPPEQQIITTLWFSFSTAFFVHRENIVSSLGRLVLIIWMFVVLIIQSSYTASLTSILTVQQLSSSIKGIDTLRASNDPIGFQVGSFAENYMVDELGISRTRLISFGTAEEYAAALLRGPENGGVAAVVDELPYIQSFLSSHCKFTVVGQEFTKSGWGFAFPRDSPLAVDLSTAILQLSENGDLQRIHDKWLMRSACNSESAEISSDRLRLTSFWGLFLICGAACLISLVIYFFLILRQANEQFQGEQDSTSNRSLPSGCFPALITILDKKVDDSDGQARER